MPKSRDDFLAPTIKALAARVNHRCSNPECRAPTGGPHSLATKAISVGIAAHICAAAPGGARYNKRQTKAQRESIANAIWLCGTCATKVDRDPVRFTVAILRRWKRDAEREAKSNMGKTGVRPTTRDVRKATPAHLTRLAKLAKGSKARVGYTRVQGDYLDTFKIEVIGVDRKHAVFRFISESGRDIYGDIPDAMPLSDVEEVWPAEDGTPIIRVRGFMKFEALRPYRYASRPAMR